MNENKQLKFASGPSTTLAVAYSNRQLAATVRYNDEKHISEGDIIDILSAHTGVKIGVGEVKHVKMTEVRDALNVITMHWAEYGMQTPEELVSRLNQYYDDPITMTTEIKVIILEPIMHQKDDNIGGRY